MRAFVEVMTALERAIVPEQNAAQSHTVAVPFILTSHCASARARVTCFLRCDLQAELAAAESLGKHISCTKCDYGSVCSWLTIGLLPGRLMCLQHAPCTQPETALQVSGAAGGVPFLLMLMQRRSRLLTCRVSDEILLAPVQH